ncbi:hypothetical protein ACRTEC_15365 [Janibacter indicus]
MTAPHDLSPQTGPRTGVFMLKVVGVLVLVGMFCAGVLSFVPGGLGGIFGGDDPPEVEGNVVWDSEDLAIQLGPNGWLTHPGDGGDYVAHNVRTGESWTIGDLNSQMSISQDGVVVQPDEAKVLVQREGSSSTRTTKEIADEFGDDDLWGGENVGVVAMGDEQVVVVTCLAPSPARLNEEVDGGSAVLAGLSLDDAAIDWVRDIGLDCGPDALPLSKPRTMPAQQYALVQVGEDHQVVVDVATGESVLERSGSPRRDIVISGDKALVREDDETVAWRSLRTGKELTRVECPGASPGRPDEITQQLAPEVTPFVTCRDSVHVVQDDAFVEIDVPPVDTGEELSDGQEVAHGRYLLERDGDKVTLRDGLQDKEIGVLDVPEDLSLGAFGPVGRLITFVEFDTGGERPRGTYLAFDIRTGDLVVRTNGVMRSGADVSPDGVILVEADDEEIEGTRLWVATTKDER